MSSEPTKPFVERAFEMARSGRFATLETMERALYEEGYPKASPHWNSTSLRKQLRKLCRETSRPLA